MQTVVKKNECSVEPGTEHEVMKPLAVELPGVEQGVVEEFVEKVAEKRIAVVAAAGAAAVQPLVETPSPMNAVAVEIADKKTACVFGKRDLQKGLLKLKPVWPDKATNPSLRYVRITIGEGEATLRASNGAITVDVKVRLYERCPTPGVIVLVGEEVLDSLKLCDSLVSFSLNTSTYICTMKTGTSQWYLHAVADHRLGDEFKVPTDPNFKPVEFKAYDFHKGLKVAAAAMSSDPSAANMYGVGFGAGSVQSTDAQCIAVYKQGTGSATFTVPAPMVLPLKKLLTEGYADSVQLRINSNQVEVTVGEDVAVFGQMPDFVKFAAVIEALEVYTPTFVADRWSFVGALTRAELFGEGLTSITIARAGDDLQFVAMKGLRKISEGAVQVTWLTTDPTFSMKIDSKALRSVIDALDGNIIDFGTGTFRGTTFCRLNEHDRTLYVLNIAA